MSGTKAIFGPVDQIPRLVEPLPTSFALMLVLPGMDKTIFWLSLLCLGEEGCGGTDAGQLATPKGCSTIHRAGYSP